MRHIANNIIYIYHIYNHNRFSFKRGERNQNVSYVFQGVFEGLENVSLHFEGILKTLHTKTTPGGCSATNFTVKGVSLKKCRLHFGMVMYGPPFFKQP